MKRHLFAASMLAALMTTIGAFATYANAEKKRMERATIEFAQPVKLLNVVLKGKYTFVHDESMTAKGKDCTYVYDSSMASSLMQWKTLRGGKLVVSFHCTGVERPKSNQFRVVTRQVDPSVLGRSPTTNFAGWERLFWKEGLEAKSEIVEIQFAGSTEAHQVP
jgi:hypothetical protein